MAKIEIDDRIFSAAAVVFDKDGTLINFHHLWGQRARAAVAGLLSAAGYDASLEKNLFIALGYDTATGQTREDGPLATIPLHKTDIVMTTVLYQHGVSWDRAEALVRQNFSPIMEAEPDADLVRPLGNPARAMAALNAAGVQTIVATTDNRLSTMKTLDMLGVLDCVDIVFCGDDAQNAKKPSPEVLHQIAARCGVPVGAMIMVGDTVSDLSMARGARAAAAIGVIGGANTRQTLLEWSDALISSIDEIRAYA